ncbi:MAG: amino acid ABC transporter substrate-binding protein [Betaproteobacteria bacterium]|nr:amino acid ABC transporter substrate-binding protein [Betaproteobacteria bacterium]
MKRMMQFIIAALACAGLVATAPAQELTGTMKKIKDTGVIKIGHRDASIPFSYLDDKQRPVGYSIDLCMKIVDAVKAELKMPGLKFEFVPVTSATRIPILTAGNIDIECGSTTNTKERQKQVSYAYTTFYTGTKLLVKANSGIKSYKDLKGKTVAVTQGTTNERAIKALNDAENLGMNFIHAKDHNESMLTVETGRAVAFPMDDILLYGLVANHRSPKDWAVVGDYLSPDPYGIMIRREDPQWQAFVNKVIGGLMKSGEIRKIYAKWFLSPIPPRNINLNLPISSTLEQLIKNPNNEGV